MTATFSNAVNFTNATNLTQNFYLISLYLIEILNIHRTTQISTRNYSEKDIEIEFLAN